ncbi:hypothetical protein E1A91_D04G016800v1 [Gossypium mustelinum]|uniref:Uncharacterized protein n=1 Tax=Gossypium mustelinum TaxID=34275 RepID=A0A5D2V986_GOSMU|nr:hypothetical protein E1A91_D04G016800v1 [Gossypium mustelinum]
MNQLNRKLKNELYLILKKLKRKIGVNATIKIPNSTLERGPNVDIFSLVHPTCSFYCFDFIERKFYKTYQLMDSFFIIPQRFYRRDSFIHWYNVVG